MKKQQDEQQGGGADWLATYADMITLLMTFFVLLFAISNVDAQKFTLLAKGLSRDGITAEEFLEIEEKFNMDGVGEPNPDDIQYPAHEDEKKPKPNEEGEEGEGEGQLGELFGSIKDYIKIHGLEDSVKAVYNGDKILLTLTNDVWFASGSAQLTTLMKEKAILMAQLLIDNQDPDSPFDIIVAGHTDNQPIGTGRYPSNWDLSVDRAVQFMRILILESDLKPGYFSARGFGEEKPIGDNATTEGRQLNRRVEILISQPKDQEDVFPEHDDYSTGNTEDAVSAEDLARKEDTSAEEPDGSEEQDG